MASVPDDRLTPRPDAREWADAFGLPDPADDPDCYDPETGDPYDTADDGGWGGHAAETAETAEATGEELFREFERTRDDLLARRGYTREQFDAFGRGGVGL